MPWVMGNAMASAPLASLTREYANSFRSIYLEQIYDQTTLQNF